MADLSFLALLLLLPPTLLFLILYVIVRPRPVKIPIKNRHVFITGGSSGIGLALAHQAATEGARVSILARSIDKLEEAKKYIQLSTGIDVSIFAADVRDYDAISKAVEEAGPVDVLIVNQGCPPPAKDDVQVYHGRASWNLLSIAVAHRLGPVPIGQTSVFIAVSSIHRVDALDACKFVIDEIKASVLIYKKKKERKTTRSKEEERKKKKEKKKKKKKK